MAKSKFTNDNGAEKTGVSIKSFIGWALTIASWVAFFFIGYVAWSIKLGLGL